MIETSPSCTFSCVSCPESQYWGISNRLHIDMFYVPVLRYLRKTSPNFTLLYSFLIYVEIYIEISQITLTCLVLSITTHAGWIVDWNMASFCLNFAFAGVAAKLCQFIHFGLGSLEERPLNSTCSDAVGRSYWDVRPSYYVVFPTRVMFKLS